MAIINCYTDLFDRHFCHRYSKYHADRVVALEDFVSLEPELVVTTAHALAAIQQIVAPKLHRQEANWQCYGNAPRTRVDGRCC